MTRSDLLAIAIKYHVFNKQLTHLATEVTSPAKVEEFREHNLRQLKHFRGLATSCKHMLGALIISMCYILIVMPVMSIQYVPLVDTILPCAVPAIIVFAAGLAVFWGLTEDCETIADLLKPLVNSKECVMARDLLKRGEPTVLAWRELAIAEREMLCVFDLHVMTALAMVAAFEYDEATAAATHEKACREFYTAEPVLSTAAPVRVG